MIPFIKRKTKSQLVYLEQKSGPHSWRKFGTAQFKEVQSLTPSLKKVMTVNMEKSQGLTVGGNSEHHS